MCMSQRRKLAQKQLVTKSVYMCVLVDLFGGERTAIKVWYIAKYSIEIILFYDMVELMMTN